ncbi:MAG: hypothetical protein AB1465_05815, partial [Patescibacteria group bacterium]
NIFMSAKKLPPSFYKYFWEIEPRDLDIQKYSFYVIERLLELGDIKQIRWLLHNFSKKEIIEVVKKSQSISLKTAVFWAFYFNIPHSLILCFKRPFHRLLKSI